MFDGVREMSERDESLRRRGLGWAGTATDGVGWGWDGDGDECLME